MKNFFNGIPVKVHDKLPIDRDEAKTLADIEAAEYNFMVDKDSGLVTCFFETIGPQKTLWASEDVFNRIAADDRFKKAV